MGFVDFARLKEEVSFSDALSHLSLDLKQAGNQWRGPCPRCESGGDRALVVTEGRGYYCFADKKGGDVIALAAHILDLPAKEAAHELAERAGIVPVRSTSTVNRTLTVPESEVAGGSKLQPLSYLEPAHDLVLAQGFDPGWCEKHGVGYAPRGVCRGAIAVPFRDQHGNLLGYLAAQDFTYIPPDFQGNVVPIKKRA